MSNVTVSIAGRSYTVACDAGQESHIGRLARSIDHKLQGIPNLAGQAESRTLLFAALLLADELDEIESAKQSAAQIAQSDEGSSEAGAAQALESLAERLEDLAKRLEDAGANA